MPCKCHSIRPLFALLSTELLIRRADLCDISLDYLAFENREGLQQVQITDRDLLQKLVTMGRLTDADRTTVKAVLYSSFSRTAFSNLPLPTRSKLHE